MVTRNWLRPGVMLLAVVAMLTALSACSSSGNDSTAGTGGGVTPAVVPSGPAPTGTPIKVGVVCTCSGPLGASIIGASDVVKAWAQNVNNTGGIEGHPIDLSLKDDQGNPGTSTTIVQKFISDHVAVVYNLSILDVAWGAATTAAKIPVVGGIFNSTNFSTNPYFYPAGQGQDSAVESLASVAKMAGADSTGLLYCAESPACQQEVGQLKAAGGPEGVPLVYSAAVSATGTSFTAQCLAAQQAKVSALAFGGTVQTAARISADCSRQGYNPIYLIQGVGYSKEYGQTNVFGKNLWMPFPMLPYFSDAPSITAMNKVVDKYYPGLRSGDDVLWGELSVQAWGGGLLIEHAIKGSGATAKTPIDAATMLKGLNSIKDDDLGGLTAPLTFTAGQPHKAECWFNAKVIDGKATLLDDGKPTCPAA